MLSYSVIGIYRIMKINVIQYNNELLFNVDIICLFVLTIFNEGAFT